jgi:hypothetical protein
MHMQPYIIQYPSTYSNCGALQRPVVEIIQYPCSNNLVTGGFVDTKESEKNMKQDSVYLQLRWCPSGLSHTQKRRLQRMHKQESVEQQLEVVPARSVTTKQVWRPKQIVSPSS